MCSGKYIRMNRLFNSSKTIIVPIDDGLISGPNNGLLKIDDTLKRIVDGQPNAILCFKGILKNKYQILCDLPIILNLSASTVNSSHTRKVLISSVEESIYLGADAVAIHINISSKYEPEMLETLGKVSRECENMGMPLLVIAYPRGEDGNNDMNYEDLIFSQSTKYTQMVMHAARIAYELGADIIKTKFTGDVESFSRVIDCCKGIPVIISGGTIVKKQDIINTTVMAMQAGSSGVCYGRNTYNRTDVIGFIQELKSCVYV